MNLSSLIQDQALRATRCLAMIRCAMIAITGLLAFGAQALENENLQVVRRR